MFEVKYDRWFQKKEKEKDTVVFKLGTICSGQLNCIEKKQFSVQLCMLEGIQDCKLMIFFLILIFKNKRLEILQNRIHLFSFQRQNSLSTKAE